MNIHPEVWGRQTWELFYYVALSYPKEPTQEDKIKYKTFYETAGAVVPCERCRINFAKHLKELPIEEYLTSGYKLFSWVTKMDNKVRKLHGRTQYSVDDTLNYYLQNLPYQPSYDMNGKQKLLLGLGGIIFLLIILKKYKYI